MSFFPRSFVSNDANPSSFHPLFRLLDDFDQYNRTPNGNEGNNHNHKHNQTRSIMRSFTPKFDVKEVGDVYELHGELPGIEQKDVSIEFTDAETLTIKGRTERSHTAGTPPNAGSIEGSSSQTKTLEDGSSSSHKDKEHQPTVEDEDANKETTLTTTNNNNNVSSDNKRSREPEAKYWVSERSVGEFSRSFTFPVRVDQERVKASMRNGVLSVVVPKARKTEAKKISIDIN